MALNPDTDRSEVDFIILDNRSNPTKFTHVPGHEDYLVRGKEVKPNLNYIFDTRNDN